MEEAGLARRLGALFIDWFVALLTTAALTQSQVLGQGAAPPLLVVLVFVVEVALLTGLLGFSIGKRLVGTRVVRPDGRPIGVPQAVLRTALVCLILPPLIMAEHQRGLHDLVAGSMAVRNPTDGTGRS